MFYVDTYYEPTAVKATSPRDAFSKRQSKATFATTLACWSHHADNSKLKRELVLRADEGFLVSRVKLDKHISLENIDYEWAQKFYKQLRQNEYAVADEVRHAEESAGYNWEEITN